MKVQLLAIGKIRSGPESALTQDYIARFNRFARPLGSGPLAVREVDSSRRDPPRTLLGSKGLGGPQSVGYALEASGSRMTSEAFAARLAHHRTENITDLAFIIGGPDGFGPEALPSSLPRLSLGPMTHPHLLVRVILTEQLYRAATILAGTPYHCGHA